jgi:primary-amine oxidase
VTSTTTPTDPPPSTAPHPLDPLDADEIRAAADAYRRHRGEADPLFARIALAEPTLDELDAFDAGGPRPPRLARVVAVAGPCALAEALVALPAGEVVALEVLEPARPPILFEEALRVIVATKEHPDWQAAMRRRGIEDLDLVQLDPWPPGTFGLPHEEGRRLTRILSYVRAFPEDNGYARPVEGVVVHADLGTGEVLFVEDRGVVPLPTESGSYYPEHVGALREDLRPISITQPEGPSFTVEGHEVRWQRWRFRVGTDPVEGLVLHRIRYEDGGRLRPILDRAALSEMVVPYGSTDPSHSWKNAFDAGEWGMGRMVNSLELGCDCLGEIHYFDVVRATERGEPEVVRNAVCMHEEDYSILWKHHDMHSFRTEVRRQRRLVVSSIYTVGNYEYGFYWYFYLDGSIQLEVKLTGIVQPQAFDPAGERPANANVIAPGLAAPHHQHLFCVRLDLAVDGPDNAVVEVDAVAQPPGPDNPQRNGIRAVATLLETERRARRRIDPAASRTWRFVNRSSTNRLGEPVSYKLIPQSSPTMLADPDSWVGRRAGFARHHLWVTPYTPGEWRAAGDHPNQSAGGDGLPAWTEADRPIVDRRIVAWHTFGVTHLVRPEDWPVMPVESTGFLLVPYGFFDRNPALDVPPSAPGGHCHAGS